MGNLSTKPDLLTYPITCLKKEKGVSNFFELLTPYCSIVFALKAETRA